MTRRQLFRVLAAVPLAPLLPRMALPRYRPAIRAVTAGELAALHRKVLIHSLNYGMGPNKLWEHLEVAAAKNGATAAPTNLVTGASYIVP